MTIRAKRGFTIVELLIVIVVIAILAAISVVAYNSIQDRSRQSKMNADIANITKAIKLARESKATALRFITNSSGTGGACWNSADNTNLAADRSTSCWTNYTNALNLIENASGVQLGVPTDPWGRPYLIDENEAENTPTNCTKDTVAVFKQPFTYGFGTYPTTPAYNVPTSGFGSC